MGKRAENLAAYVNRSRKVPGLKVSEQPPLVVSDKQAAKIARRKARMG